MGAMTLQINLYELIVLFYQGIWEQIGTWENYLRFLCKNVLNVRKNIASRNLGVS
jgi:hypothetical protein